MSKREHDEREEEAKHARREERSDVTEPPLEGEGGPEPPLQENPPLPAGKVRVYGDASATYGSMIPPDVIRPYADEIEEITEPARKKQAQNLEKQRQAEPPPEAKPVPVYEKLQRYPGEGAPPLEPAKAEDDKVKEKPVQPAQGEEAEDERNKKREAKEDEPSKGPHDR